MVRPLLYTDDLRTLATEAEKPHLRDEDEWPSAAQIQLLRDAADEIEQFRRLVSKLSDRVHKQSELLSRTAESQPAGGPTTMSNAPLDLSDYLPDAEARERFVAALKALLEQSRGWVPVSVGEELVAWLVPVRGVKL